VLASLKQGQCAGTRVSLMRFQQSVNTACVETLQFVSAFPEAIARTAAPVRSMPPRARRRRDAAHGQSNIPARTVGLSSASQPRRRLTVLKARPGRTSTESPLVRVRQHRRRQTMLSYDGDPPMTGGLAHGGAPID